MITKFRIAEANAEQEFGMACQRLLPWSKETDEPPFGVMACFLPAGSASEPDCHDQDEVMIILSGTGGIDIAGEHESFGTNEVIVIPRNREHVVHNPTDGMLTWVSFYWPLHEPVAARPPAEAVPGEAA